ncbi:MAG: solute carrier 26 family protein [Chloroflexi bacterium]|nr:solute carrier 26 family protein [Chloroflexota bacterium]
MATLSPASPQTNTGIRDRFDLRSALPFLSWLANYRREDLLGDLLAGIIVAIMLVPQAMAYAMLAGLPPEVGLYASISPLIIYGFLGTSRTLAVGPVAIVSLMVATGVGAIATAGTGDYIALAVVLALMVGIIQVAMGLMRVGFLVNFLSHPVLSGFTNAAAIYIGLSQVKHVLGVQMPRQEHTYETLFYLVGHFGESNLAVLGLGFGAIAVLVYFKTAFARHLARFGLREALLVPITKTGPLVVVVVGSLLVAVFGLNQSAQVPIVGDVPAGLPTIAAPDLQISDIQVLLPIALTISIVGFMESITVAKSLASRRRQKVNANQELVALGTANLGAAFTGGYPVTGGLARSMVNFSAGANTGLASIITALLIGITVIFFTPLFYFLPNAVLGAIILVAVANLIDFQPLAHAWHYDHTDAISFVVTFIGVLALGIEYGILLGAASALLIHLWRTSRPHIAIVGRVGETEHFRNILRYETRIHPEILAIRVDESLYFANAQYLENTLLNTIAEHKEVEHLVLVCSGVNYIDTSALEALEKLIDQLHSSGVNFYLAEVKGPVMDRLQRIGFIDHLGIERVFLNAHAAIQALAHNN